MPENDIIVVLTNVPDENCAELIAKALIEAKLAACVNIGNAGKSVYEWKDKIEMQAEIPIYIKTSKNDYTKIETLILEMHPYELPDIIALTIYGGLEPYLQWVNAQLSH
jgi:periplasmic divalent cation tolerance protein